MCMENMNYVSEETLIGDILNDYPCAVPMLQSIGMMCIGCPSSRGETLAQACAVHGMQVDVVVRALNLRIKAAKAKGEA